MALLLKFIICFGIHHNWIIYLIQHKVQQLLHNAYLNWSALLLFRETVLWSWLSAEHTIKNWEMKLIWLLAMHSTEHNIFCDLSIEQLNSLLVANSQRVTANLDVFWGVFQPRLNTLCHFFFSPWGLSEAIFLMR